MKPTVQEALAAAIAAAATNPAVLERALDELSELFLQADRIERNGGRDPHEFLLNSEEKAVA